MPACREGRMVGAAAETLLLDGKPLPREVGPERPLDPERAPRLALARVDDAAEVRRADHVEVDDVENPCALRRRAGSAT